MNRLTFSSMSRYELEAELNRCNGIMVKDGERIGMLKNALERILRVKPMPEAGNSDLWLAIGEIRGVASNALHPENQITVPDAAVLAPGWDGGAK